MKRKERMSVMLEKFKKMDELAKDITTMWYEEEDFHGDEFSEDAPFDQSFDEFSARLSTFVETQEEIISKIK